VTDRRKIQPSPADEDGTLVTQDEVLADEGVAARPMNGSFAP